MTNMATIQDTAREWNRGCKKMQSHRSLIDEWLRFVELQSTGAAMLSSFDKEALSYFTTATTCPGEPPRAEVVPIEPLVGFLRHPMAFCISGKGHILDTSYLMFGSPASVPAGKKWVFDVGASKFLSGAGGASQSWLVDRYER